MKRLKKVMLVLLVLSVGSLLAGCRKGKEIDPEKYVSAYLKANLSGDVADMAELSGQKKEDLEKEYNKSIEDLQSALESVASIGEGNGEKITDVCKKLLSSAKYEVKGSKKDDKGNYTVDVEVQPSDVMNVLMQKSFELGMEGIDDMGDALIQAMEAAVADQSYGDAQTYQIKITKDSKGVYSIDETDAAAVIKGMFAETDDVLKPSGKVYDNPYFNWTKTEWDAASEEEKSNCCLAIMQDLGGYSDEQMATIDLNNAEVQSAIQDMKDGITLSYSGGAEISIGDYVELIRKSGAIE